MNSPTVYQNKNIWGSGLFIIYLTILHHTGFSLTQGSDELTKLLSRGKTIHWNCIVSRCYFWQYSYRITGLVLRYLTICPKVQFPKKMIALTYFKTIFIISYKVPKCYWNTLITYMTNGGILHRHCYTKKQTSKMVLNLSGLSHPFLGMGPGLLELGISSILNKIGKKNVMFYA